MKWWALCWNSSATRSRTAPGMEVGVQGRTVMLGKARVWCSIGMESVWCSVASMLRIVLSLQIVIRFYLYPLIVCVCVWCVCVMCECVGVYDCVYVHGVLLL